MEVQLPNAALLIEPGIAVVGLMHRSLMSACVGPSRHTAFIEQVTSPAVSLPVQMGRDGIERSWRIRAAGRLESICEHEQCLEVFRDAYPEPLACIPEHAQPVRFVDLRIRHGN